MELSLQAENVNALLNRGKQAINSYATKKEKALSDVKNTLHVVRPAGGLSKGHGTLPGSATPAKPCAPTPAKNIVNTAVTASAWEIYEDDTSGHHDHAKCESSSIFDDLSELRLSQTTIDHFSQLSLFFKPTRMTSCRDVITILPDVQVPQFLCPDYDFRDSYDSFNDSLVMEPLIVPPL